MLESGGGPTLGPLCSSDTVWPQCSGATDSLLRGLPALLQVLMSLQARLWAENTRCVPELLLQAGILLVLLLVLLRGASREEAEVSQPLRAEQLLQTWVSSASGSQLRSGEQEVHSRRAGGSFFPLPHVCLLSFTLSPHHVFLLLLPEPPPQLPQPVRGPDPL